MIRCYVHVRDHYDLIARYLKSHVEQTCEDYYYSVRTRYNDAGFSAAQAARFIYLNKTCFNGIFRVNTRGEFNVPYGWKEPPALPSATMLASISGALKGAELRACNFQAAVEHSCKGDLIYLDPPYPPLNGTAYFTHYTASRFGDSDHEKVAAICKELDRGKCLLLVSNADTPKIRQLYRQFNCNSVEVTRFVTCKSKHVARELIITNYEIPRTELSI